MTEWRSYVLWVEYLQTTDPATWAPAVRKDFGTCVGQDAAAWASDHRHTLFSGPRGSKAPTIYRGQKLSATEIAVVIDVTASDERINDKLAVLIEGHREDCGITGRKGGRSSWTPRRGKWRLSKNVEDSALIALDAWRARERGLKLADVGLEIAKRHGVAKTAARDRDNKELSTVASKYLRIADKIRAAVINGVFPA